MNWHKFLQILLKNSLSWKVLSLNDGSHLTFIYDPSKHIYLNPWSPYFLPKLTNLEWSSLMRAPLRAVFQYFCSSHMLAQLLLERWSSSLLISDTDSRIRAQWSNKFKKKYCTSQCDPPCKDGSARFTTVPWKTLPDQEWIRYSIFLFIFIVVSLLKFFVHF